MLFRSISKPVSWPFAGGMASCMHTYDSSVNLIVDMGGSDAPLHVSVGVSGVLKVVTSLTHEDSGSFINFKGERLPW